MSERERQHNQLANFLGKLPGSREQKRRWVAENFERLVGLAEEITGEHGRGTVGVLRKLLIQHYTAWARSRGMLTNRRDRRRAAKATATAYRRAYDSRALRDRDRDRIRREPKPVCQVCGAPADRIKVQFGSAPRFYCAAHVPRQAPQAPEDHDDGFGLSRSGMESASEAAHAALASVQVGVPGEQLDLAAQRDSVGTK